MIDVAIASLNLDAQTWPAVTDFDRLTTAFAALNQVGVLSLVDAGNTQTDGYEDFLVALERHAHPGEVIGYCFFHGQDAERAVEGGGLFLAFGPTSSDNEHTDGPRIGHLICDELRRAGLAPKWNGTFAQRIQIPGFTWQRRPKY